MDAVAYKNAYFVRETTETTAIKYKNGDFVLEATGIVMGVIIKLLFQEFFLNFASLELL